MSYQQKQHTRKRPSVGGLVKRFFGWLLGILIPLALLAGVAAFLGFADRMNVQTRECTITTSEFDNGRRGNDYFDLTSKECGNLSTPIQPGWGTAPDANCDPSQFVRVGGVYRITSGGFDLFWGLLPQKMYKIEFVSLPEGAPECDAGGHLYPFDVSDRLDKPLSLW